MDAQTDTTALIGGWDYAENLKREIVEHGHGEPASAIESISRSVQKQCNHPGGAW